MLSINLSINYFSFIPSLYFHGNELYSIPSSFSLNDSDFKSIFSPKYFSISGSTSISLKGDSKSILSV